MKEIRWLWLNSDGAVLGGWMFAGWWRAAACTCHTSGRAWGPAGVINSNTNRQIVMARMKTTKLLSSSCAGHMAGPASGHQAHHLPGVPPSASRLSAADLSGPQILSRARDHCGLACIQSED